MLPQEFAPFLVIFFTIAARGQPEISEVLQSNEYDLSKEGKTFILREAQHTSFLLLGELHGEKEIPVLIYS